MRLSRTVWVQRGIRRAAAVCAGLALTGAGLTSSSGASHPADFRYAPGTQAEDPQDVSVAAPAAAGITASHWVDGVTRIEKLDSELKIGRGRFDSTVGVSGNPPPLTGTLTLPPSDGYFVTFRFMPTTSRVDLVPDGETTGVVHEVSTDPDSGMMYADVETTVSVFIRLSNVEVDGTPLPVGGECRTAEPARIPVSGRLWLAQNPAEAPPTKVRATYDIPRFSGCGLHEDLDPLLSGLVSGPGNTVDLTLTLRCISDQNCPSE